jgi:tellurite resistance protein TerC
MTTDQWGWTVFGLCVVVMLLLDLGLFHRTAHEVRFKEAASWSLVWVLLAVAFGGLVWLWRGWPAASDFYTAYLIEESLSIDNLFVFLLIFHYFQVPRQYEHRVLFWGILGALVMRAGFIVAGVALLQTFHWIFYVFGALLIFTGIRLALEKDKKIQPERNPVLRLFRRLMPVTSEYEGGHFIVWRDGRPWATPLLLVLIVVETTDLIFAVDSIPAVLAITQDPFIVYTSNVFAIMGLRSLYFALAGMMRLFHYLHYGLALILVFVGVKMLLGADWYEIPSEVALATVAGILAISVVLSLIFPSTPEQGGGSPASGVPPPSAL